MTLLCSSAAAPTAGQWPSPFSAGNCRASRLLPAFYVSDFIIKAEGRMNTQNCTSVAIPGLLPLD